MQKGRGYRAALPRNNLYEWNYNQRWPMRLDFQGQFDYHAVTLFIPSVQVRGKAVYDPLALTWSNANSFTIGADTFSANAVLLYVPVAWMWRVTLEVSDGAGAATVGWDFDIRHMDPIGHGANWIFPVPNIRTTTGFFGPIAFFQFLPVVYANE
jgi:hypothetical protein